MILLDIRNLKVAFGTTTILEDVSLTVKKGERVGLIGANGAGKTTLFKTILGSLPADAGSVFMPKGLSIGYLAQHHVFHGSETVLQSALSVFDHIFALEEQLRALEHAMAQNANDAQALEQINKKYMQVNDQYEELGGYSAQSRVFGVLRGLGLKDEYFDRTVSSLSGGEQTRLALAKLLLQNHDILLLDEPTNHLDLNAVDWLTDFLSQSPATIFIISHDRYLLDKLCTQIAEIENKQLFTYSGNYTQYRQKREDAKRIQQKQYEEQQKEIARQQEIIERFRSFNREKSIRAAESREKKLEKMELIQPPSQQRQPKLSFKAAKRSGNEVLAAKGITAAYGDKAILDPVDLFVKAGQRIALIGPNGAGKTTLFKVLLGKLSHGGEVKWGANTDIGYYAQQQEGLDPQNTILDEIWLADRSLSQTQVRNIAASLLFTNDDVFKRISTLSGGERARVALCKLSVAGHNVLLLDEPTNHLDMDSRELLESALQDFSGTLIFISHDRYFINKLADTVWVIENRTITQYSGNYDSYKAQLQPPSQEESTITKTQKAKQQKAEKLAGKEKRQRKLELQQTEEEITQTENEIAQIEALFADASTYNQPEAIQDLNNRYNALLQKRDELYAKWSQLSESLESCP